MGASERLHLRVALRSIVVSVISSFCLLITVGFLPAEGLPVSKYLEDQERNKEIFGFYLDSVLLGISLANDRAEVPLFCTKQGGPEFSLEMLDQRINKLQKAKQITPSSTVDTIMLDLLMEIYPCR